MSLSLSDADLKTIANQLFLLKSPAPTKLPKPTNTDTEGPGTLASRLKPIAENTRFKDFGIGVVDFSLGVLNPKVWLHNGDLAWRIGSTGKIAILLAAVQLRDDVRKVKKTGLISTPKDFDTLFETIWKDKRLNLKDPSILEIAKSPPRISTIFDLTKPDPEFTGEGTLDKLGIFDNRLHISIDRHGSEHRDLLWSLAPGFSFWERLWLTGARSDNVAATTCVSEIGVPYMKAVQRAYGLFDPAKGMHLLLSGGYGPVVTTTHVNNSPGAPNYRPLQFSEKHKVIDILEGFADRSDRPGSAAALTAYMIALMQDNLVGQDPILGGQLECDIIRTHLANEVYPSLTSFIPIGVKTLTVPPVPVSKEHTKIGLLGSVDCEFAYLEAGVKKYAVLVTGIKPTTIGPPGHRNRLSKSQLSMELGAAVHNALSAP